MALQRTASGSKTSRNDTDKDEEDMENNGYIQVFVKPLEQGNYSVVLGWLGINQRKLTPQQCSMCYAIGGLLSTVLLYRLIFYDLGYIFSRLCSLTVPVFSIICGFYWISLYLRKTWSNTSVYLLFCGCYLGEFIGQCFLMGYEQDTDAGLYITRPLLVGVVLLSASLASIFASLDSIHSTLVIVAVSFTRFLACTTLNDLPQGLRPFIAYTSGIAGVILSKYMETLFKPQINHFMTQDGKIPVIKRRRSSSSSTHGFNSMHHRTGRRTSLPALIQKGQGSSASYEAALISEAHGLISDMLADSTLPPHVVSGLRAVSSLLKPPESHTPASKPRVSPLVSLTETSSYGSDNEDLPYTGERPSSLPKRLRRSLPPSLIRRMSTSTWTTTTSATGMPTLEPEPCRTRTSSFRHTREGTPGSSPANSRSNSPSPSSPTTISLTIPKSRSFSVASMGSYLPNQKRFMKERKSLFLHADSASNARPDLLKPSPLVMSNSKTDSSQAPGAKDAHPVGLAKRLNITSDYESSDSPSSSDHSDNIMTGDEGIGASPKLPTTAACEAERLGVDRQEEEEEESKSRSSSLHKRDVTDSSESTQKTQPNSQLLQRHVSDEPPFSIEEVNSNELLAIGQLSQWDYPIFDMACHSEFSVLSQVAYRLFTEVGLFDTFRIPLREFLNFFHALELGYRNKPYHNRVHATDVLHGVYYLTTQPIPGFPQVNPEDVFGKHGSSSESDSELGEKSGCNIHRPSFTAEDTYGIMGGNFPALELMALYTAAAMHDYDHPGRTNAFLVTTHAPQAILYNDRSVLENHHAAAAWQLFLSDKRYNWLCHLDKAEFKRFRFLVIEAILATDLKRHFELLAEFNAKVNFKVNDDDAPGIDWTSEGDRLMVSNMTIKLADINGPCKTKDLHVQWTYRITEEFYEQGDEEAQLGLPISPYMDRKHPQLAKLQESFINHLVAPLANALAAAGLLPGTWVDACSDTEGASDSEKGGSSTKETEEDDTEHEIVGASPSKLHKRTKKIHCLLTRHLKENHDMWVDTLKKEAAEKAAQEGKPEEEVPVQVEEEPCDKGVLCEPKPEMEPIKEEDTPPSSGKLDHSPQEFGAAVFNQAANSPAEASDQAKTSSEGEVREQAETSSQADSGSQSETSIEAVTIGQTETDSRAEMQSRVQTKETEASGSNCSTPYRKHRDPPQETAL